MKLNLLIVLTSFIFCQTNITTPMGSTGFGVWTTASKPFKGNNTDISLIFDLHLPFGLEVSFGKSVPSVADYSFNQIGVAYDIKLYDWGSKLYGKRFDIDDFDFQGEFEKEELGLEFYKRGRKLNSLVRISHLNYNNLGYIYDSFLTLGGVGRMTRLITIGFGIKMPFEELFHMRYSDIELTMGTSF